MSAKSFDVSQCVTHANTDVTTLVGKHVRGRPYYVEPASVSSMRLVRSPWVRPAVVEEIQETEGETRVLVRYEAEGPWRRIQSMRPRDLHNFYRCKCPACIPGGLGIAEQDGP